MVLKTDIFKNVKPSKSNILVKKDESKSSKKKKYNFRGDLNEGYCNGYRFGCIGIAGTAF